MADIFICYRREDSEAHAGRLYDPLAARFGAAAVFLDVDTLNPGVDFDVVIQSTLGRCNVVLVIIGPGFFSHRLRDTNDFVRREIVAALRGRKRVIPVLVGGASLPSKRQVPQDVAPLLGKNAVTLNHATWKDDVGRLIRALEKILRDKRRSPAARRGSSRPDASERPPTKRKPTRKGSSPQDKQKASSGQAGVTSKRKRVAAAAADEKPRPGAAATASAGGRRKRPSKGAEQEVRRRSAPTAQPQPAAKGNSAGGKRTPSSTRAKKGVNELSAPVPKPKPKPKATAKGAPQKTPKKQPASGAPRGKRVAGRESSR